MEKIRGFSAQEVERQLDCWLDEQGRLAFWIHSVGPNPKNTSEIHVNPAELLHLLIRLCVRERPFGSETKEKETE